MSNIGLVKDLLETASTLLNESSGSNGLAKRIYEEKYGKKSKKDIEKDKEKLEKLKSHSVSEESDKKIDKKMHDLRTDERNRDILNKSAKNANGRIHSEISKGEQSLDAHVNYSNNNRAEYLDDKMEEVRRKLRENSTKTSRVNQNINERAKKSTNPHEQRKHITNETISELLIEAAELLTEGSSKLPGKKNEIDDKDIKFALVKFIQEEKLNWANKSQADIIFKSIEKTMNDIDDSSEFKRLTVNKTHFLLYYGKDTNVLIEIYAAIVPEKDGAPKNFIDKVVNAKKYRDFVPVNLHKYLKK